MGMYNWFLLWETKNGCTQGGGTMFAFLPRALQDNNSLVQSCATGSTAGCWALGGTRVFKVFQFYGSEILAVGRGNYLRVPFHLELCLLFRNNVDQYLYKL